MYQKQAFIILRPNLLQAVARLEATQPLTGAGQYVFPSNRGDPVNVRITIRTALKSLAERYWLVRPHHNLIPAFLLCAIHCLVCNFYHVHMAGISLVIHRNANADR